MTRRYLTFCRLALTAFASRGAATRASAPIFNDLFVTSFFDLMDGLKSREIDDECGEKWFSSVAASYSRRWRYGSR